MATDITNGIGGEITVDSTATVHRIADKGSSKTAMTLRIWNTGGITIRVSVNEDTQTSANAVAIPAGEDFWFVGQPLRMFIATADSSTTATWGAF